MPVTRDFSEERRADDYARRMATHNAPLRYVVYTGGPLGFYVRSGPVTPGEEVHNALTCYYREGAS